MLFSEHAERVDGKVWIETAGVEGAGGVDSVEWY